MENFEPNIDDGWDDTKETKAELNEFQRELIKENEPEIEAIKKAIGSLKSFKDLPVNINYPISSKEKIAQKKFPKTLDMRPKPVWDRRKNNKWEIIDSPDPLIICLDGRKFTITPDIGKISDIGITMWNIKLQISKFGIVLKNETYDPDRMTKLLIILWTHKSGLNKDITNTPRADVKEIK